MSTDRSSRDAPTPSRATGRSSWRRDLYREQEREQRFGAGWSVLELLASLVACL